MHSNIKLTAALSAVLLSLSACSGTDPILDVTEEPTETIEATPAPSESSKPSEASTESASKDTKTTVDNSNGEELVLALGDVTTGEFDPVKGWGTHGQHFLTHSTLLAYDDDLSFMGDLAEEWEPSNDGKTWTFQLREGVKFSDGTELTSKDIKFSFELLQKEGEDIDLSYIAEIETPGDYTVEFHLKNPNSLFLNNMVEVPIVPADSYGDDYSENPIASGPYVVEEYKEGEQLIMVANPYYDKQLTFTKLTFLLLDEDAALAAAKAGDVDVTYVPPSLADEEIDDMHLEAYESLDVRGLSMPNVKAGGKGKTAGEDVEVGNDVTSDLAIRQAIAIGVDREKLVDLTLMGHGRPAYSMVDGTPYFNEETKVEDGDIKGAKKILEEGGWEDTNNDGTVDKDGVEAEFPAFCMSHEQLRCDLALAVAAQIKDLGIKLVPESVSPDEAFRDAKTGAFVFGGGSQSPIELQYNYHSDNIDKAWGNFAMYSNDKVDEYIEKAISSTDEEERNEYWQKAQYDGKQGVGLNADAPIIWLVSLDHTYMVRDGIDLGKRRIHSHGETWQLFANVSEWKAN